LGVSQNLPVEPEPSRRFNLLFTVEGSGIQGTSQYKHFKSAFKMKINHNYRLCTFSRSYTSHKRHAWKDRDDMKDVYFSFLPLTLLSKFPRLRLLWIIGLCLHAAILDANGTMVHFASEIDIWPTMFWINLSFNVSITILSQFF
jgi:hypothetical protein